MKKITILGTILLSLAIAVTGCGSKDPVSSPENVKAADELKITFADYGSSAMPTAQAYNFTADYIREKSDGRIDIDVVSDGVLGNETEMIQQLMDGTMKMAIVGSSVFSKYTDKIEAFQLPLLITDYNKEKIAFNSPEGKALLDTAEDIGVKVIGYAENGIRHFANNIRPINSPEDLDGLIIRIAPSTMLQKSMELLGANPTPLNYGEVYTALQNKVIDGEEINVTSLYAMKHYETIKYVSEIGLYPFPSLVVVNLDFWNSLTPEDQALIEEGFSKGTDELMNYYLPAFEEKSKNECEEVGLEFNVIEDKKAFADKVKPVYEEYKAKDPKIKAFIEVMEGLQ
nr:DctP family TRAP transporter solute-binding subunit [Sedimentibacter sp.]